MAEALTRYDHENIQHLIGGYLISRHHDEPIEAFFERAKAELVENLEKRLNQVKAYTFADYTKKLK